MKFSILTSCFNCGPYVAEAIESYLGQTYLNKELVIVDDCSTDNSWDIISSYASKNTNIIAVRNNQRLYCSGSYNVALKMATGEFCGILDSDDVLLPNAMEKVAKYYIDNPTLAYIYTQFFWCNDKLKFLKLGISGAPAAHSSQVDCCLRWKHSFSHWRTFRTKCRDSKELFPPGLKYGVDKVLGFNLEEVGSGGFVNIPLYKYRFHKSNMTHYAIEDQKKSILKYAAQRKKERREQNIKVYRVNVL